MIEPSKQFLQLNIKGKTIKPDRANVSLNSNLVYTITQQEPSIDFIKKASEIQQGKSLIINPLCHNKSKQGWILLVQSFGECASQLLLQNKRLFEGQFAQKIVELFIKLAPILPKITLDCLYVDNKKNCKIIPVRSCQDDEYLKDLKSILKQTGNMKSSLYYRIQSLSVSKQLENIYKEEQKSISLPKLLERKLNPKKPQPYKITLSQQERQWMLSSLSLKSNCKLQLVYDGKQNNFDPIPLLKSINKQTIIYIIETNKNKRIVFYAGVAYDNSSVSIFGNYLYDKSKKSMILGLQHKSIHLLQDEKYAVGYGQEILLCIGKADIVLSALNINNICYFPVSYRQDQKAGVTTGIELLGQNFILKQFQAYKVTA